MWRKVNYFLTRRVWRCFTSHLADVQHKKWSQSFFALPQGCLWMAMLRRWSEPSATPETSLPNPWRSWRLSSALRRRWRRWICDWKCRRRRRRWLCSLSNTGSSSARVMTDLRDSNPSQISSSTWVSVSDSRPGVTQFIIPLEMEAVIDFPTWTVWSLSASRISIASPVLCYMSGQCHTDLFWSLFWRNSCSSDH